MILIAQPVVSIGDTEEVDLDRNRVSWVSPLAPALMRAAEADELLFIYRAALKP